MPTTRSAVLSTITLAVYLTIPADASAQVTAGPPLPCNSLGEATDRIGWNFGYAFGGGADLGEDEIAGLNDPSWGDFRQDCWNNDPTLDQNPSPASPDIADLVDSKNHSTGVSLDWSYTRGTNSWRMDDLPMDPTGDEKLTYGYQANDPRIVLENIPYACYTLVLYYNQDGTQSNSDVNLSVPGGAAITTRRVSTGDPDSIVGFFTDYKNGGYRVEDGEGPPIPSNVTVFYGLQAPDLQIDFVWPNDLSIGNAGTQALQIVDAPSCIIFTDGFESGDKSLWM